MAERKKPGPKKRKDRKDSTRAKWWRVLDATREMGFESAQGVAARAKVHRTTVTLAWRDGWPKFGLPPITAEIIADKEGARALLIKSAERGGVRREHGVLIEDLPDDDEAAKITAVVDDELRRQKARIQAAEDRAEEARGVRVFRQNSIAFGVMVAALSRQMLKLPALLETALTREERDKKNPLTSRQILALMRTSARVSKESVEAMKVAVVLNRLILGEPGEIVGVTTGELTPESAASWIKRANRALERQEKFKEWGKLELVERPVDDDGDQEEVA